MVEGRHVATHASALKAHRQSLVRRERARRYRTELRSTLKSIRALIERRDSEGIEKQLRRAIALIDKTASKGVIHRNTAGRYKSRLMARLAKLHAA
jgi:small subunit ribosomal protein S20